MEGRYGNGSSGISRALFEPEESYTAMKHALQGTAPGSRNVHPTETDSGKQGCSADDHERAALEADPVPLEANWGAQATPRILSDVQQYAEQIREATVSPMTHLSTNLARLPIFSSGDWPRPQAMPTVGLRPRPVQNTSQHYVPDPAYHKNSENHSSGSKMGYIGSSQGSSSLSDLPFPFSSSFHSPRSSCMPLSARTSPRVASASSPSMFKSSPCRTLMASCESLDAPQFDSPPSPASRPGLFDSASAEDFFTFADSNDTVMYPNDVQSQFSDECPSTQQLSPDETEQQQLASLVPRSSPSSTQTCPNLGLLDSPSGRYRARTVHLSSRTESLVDLCSSPSRFKGAVSMSSQRTTAFLSNPRPAPNRARRDSIARPRPRLSTDTLELGKVAPVLANASPTGLIPHLKNVDIPPPSPSRGLTSLPSFCLKGDYVINRITTGTLARLLRGDFQHLFSEYYIIDCRSEVEYAGGHIRGALSAVEPGVAIENFITSRLAGLQSAPRPHGVALIFHCEFSISRGPNTIKAFRNADRSANSWPTLFYPEIYCLDGGYREFFAQYQEFCDPVGYVPEPNRDRRNSISFRKPKMSRSLSSGSLDVVQDEEEEDAQLLIPSGPTRAFSSDCIESLAEDDF